MDTAFQKYPRYVTPADTNLMLDVLMQMERYASCVSVLTDYMNIELSSTVSKSESRCLVYKLSTLLTF